MALMQHGYRDFSSGVRVYGATASNSAYPYALHKQFTSFNRNLTAGEGIATNLAGIPSGYRERNAWVLPQSPGALTSRNRISGEGDVASSIAGGKNAEASISGSGDLTGTAALIVSLVAAISGSGDITQADAVAYLQLAAALAGDCDVAGAATALGHAAAALGGDGDASATATATGTLAAALVVTGAGLTTSNVGDAVWESLLEAGFSASQIVRIIAAATAGEHTQSGTDVTFRNLADTQDQITGTVDANGNRSAITYGD